MSLKVTEADISNLTASIRSPSGLEEPCVLKRLANGHLGIVVVIVHFGLKSIAVVFSYSVQFDSACAEYLGSCVLAAY